MKRRDKGFTLIELIAIVVILGVVSITVSTRFTDNDIASLQTSRDDLVAALFFAQQKAMAQTDISLVVSASGVDVRQAGNSLYLHQGAYPLTFAGGVSATPAQSYNYNKLGQITNLASAAQITLQKGGTSAVVMVEPSGYAH